MLYLTLDNDENDLEWLRVKLKVPLLKKLEQSIVVKNKKGQMPIIFVDNIEKAFKLNNTG